MTRVVVTGGRNYRDRATVLGVFRRLTVTFGSAGLTLLCGMAAGADSLAWQAANELEWKEIEEYPADWDGLGKKAGVLRNQKMVDAKPDFCVAFPGGAGTADMIRRCDAAGVKVYKFT